MGIWNPWHGCHKYSAGCLNCYVYRRDSQFGKASDIVQKTADFNLPFKRTRDRGYKLTEANSPVYTCMTSDFFIEEADEWREEAWRMIKWRSELHFVIITKRIKRFTECIPEDWGDGYENVTIVCTCENQEEADRRLPVFIDAPVKHREIIHEPMLGAINTEKYLKTGLIEAVTCGGESGDRVRLCDYDWILDMRRQCIKYDVPFYFKQTGALFKKDGRIYHIKRKDQIEQAWRAGINYGNKKDMA